jgi:broad-specificity NMP kinase
MIKSRRLRWADHVTCMMEMRYANKILDERLKEREYSEDKT